jgi:hypothetical protein
MDELKQLHAYLHLSLDEGKWYTSTLGRFNPHPQPSYVQDRRLGSSEMVCTGWRMTKCLPLPRIEMIVVQPQLVTIPTEFPGSLARC